MTARIDDPVRRPLKQHGEGWVQISVALRPELQEKLDDIMYRERLIRGRVIATLIQDYVEKHEAEAARLPNAS